jgi:hypothetical protein
MALENFRVGIDIFAVKKTRGTIRETRKTSLLNAIRKSMGEMKQQVGSLSSLMHLCFHVYFIIFLNQQTTWHLPALS